MKNTPITENHLFVKAYTRGKSIKGQYVVVYALKDKAAARFIKADPCHREINRLGLTTSKKIGGAVVRNRARRLMREAYRLTEKENTVRHGYLLVIAAKTTIADADLHGVRSDIEDALIRLHLLDGKAENIDA